MRVLLIPCALVLLTLVCLAAEQTSLTKLAPKPWLDPTQENDNEPRQPAGPRAIIAATAEFQKAVNGKASVRNHCRAQDKEIEIEETSEIIEKDRCKIILKTKKTTRPSESHKDSAGSPGSTEFMIYADLSDLTTPVLTEKQRFAQCDAGALDVVKVSSHTDPKQPIRVVRRALTAKDGGSQQTRKDLSLFFADAKAAKRAADALERAIKACGGKEWPDEDDLP